MSRTLLALAFVLLAAPLSAAPPVTALAFAPDGKSVLVGSQDGLEVRSYPTLESIRALPTEIPNIHDLAFSPDGKTLAVAGGTPGKRGTVEFWSWPDGKTLRSSSSNRDSVYKVAWRSDSAALLTAGGGATVGLIDVGTAKVSRTFEGHSKGVLAVAFLPGDSQFVSAGLDESVRLWSVESGEVFRSFPNHTRAVTDLAVRPGTNVKAPPTVASVGEDRTVRLWQPTVGRLVRFARLESVPLAAAWSRDGGQLYTACKDGRLRVLDPDTVEVTKTLDGIDDVAYCLAVAADGHVLLGGRGGQLKRLAIQK